MLTKCLECGGKVSDKATACPHCGAPVPVSNLKEIGKSDRKESASLVENGQADGCEPKLSDVPEQHATANPQGVHKAPRRYVLESFIILVIVIATPFVAGICNLIAEVVLEEFHAVKQAFSTAVAFSILYLAWPIELVVRKYNSPKTGRLIGNVLMTLLASLVVLVSLGVVFERTLCQGVGWETADCVPFVVLALGIFCVKMQRTFKDPSAVL